MFSHSPGRLPLRTIVLFLVILSFVQASLADTTDEFDFVDIGAGLVGVGSAWNNKTSAAWGDYDNDGDLDILLTGEASSGGVSLVYRNDGSSFVDIGASLQDVSLSSGAWGDYDNDGDLDILLTGSTGSGHVSIVYRNDDGSFVDIGAGLTGVFLSSVAWGDYDNDGDLDILMTGRDINLVYVSLVYRNDGGSFVDIEAGLTGVIQSSVAWGDYDNDGDLDILLTGETNSASVSQVYRNDGGSFVNILAPLARVETSSVAWGDYDNDGDLDILLTGQDTNNLTYVSSVYRNDDGSFVDVGAGLTGVFSSSAAWGDYDNDGDLDILLTGRESFYVRTSRVYRNDSGSFIDIGASLTATTGSATWGDYDNDGDLDILLAGGSSSGPVSLVYRNDSPTSANTPPAAPTNLVTQVEYSTVTFSWDAATDVETPSAGLTYNLRVGTTPGGNEIISAMSDGSGYHHIPALGNTNHNTSWTIELPEPFSSSYFWSVQAVDACFAGSEFADEQPVPVEFEFVSTGADLTGVDFSSVAWGDYDNDGDLDILLTGTSNSRALVSRVYRNDGGNFMDIEANLAGVHLSSVAWGDYDNDGDLDILLTGYRGGPLSLVYRNDGGNFVDIGAPLMDVHSSSVAWGDYDNDGDLDILLTGVDNNYDYVSIVYRNDGGNFLDIGAPLTGVANPAVAWGDYDSDGDLDILLTGYTGSHYVSIVYRNDAGSFVDIGAGLRVVGFPSVAWGDYDNDGDLDILLTGYSGYDGHDIYLVSLVYRNDGGNFVDIEAPLTGVYRSSVSWGDYDNDGDLDILLTGLDSGIVPVSLVYRNDDGSFVDIEAPLMGVWVSSAAWGDYDNDEDLDILLTGASNSGPVSIVYRNDAPLSPNTPPTAPTNLTTVMNGSTVTFSWDAATDAETPPAGLTYNLRVGTTPGGNEITSAMSDESGYHLTPALGNTNHNTSWTIELPEPFFPSYYWSVQAVDVCFAGSEFAGEQLAHYFPSFEDSEALLTGVYYSSVAWGDYDNDGDLDILLTGAYNSTTGRVSLVYRNDGGSFVDIGAPMTGVRLSSVAWGDYDNDGDLDILLTGDSSSGAVSFVYRNDGGNFVDIGALLTGVYYSSVAWGDYDNDGDLDILLTGRDSNGVLVSLVYRNDGGSFVDIGATLTDVGYSSVAWGDYDNDGDLDILLTGNNSSGVPVSLVYRNDGGNFVDIGAPLTGIYYSSVAWGDYDNDGDLDILLTGRDTISTNVSLVYRNDAGNFVDIMAPLTGVGYSSAAWGDYDNDGDLDILLTGRDNSFAYVSLVYHNDGSSFMDIEAPLTGVYASSVAWNDFDNDGDLDILLTGRDNSSDQVSLLYRNDFPVSANIPPAAPTNLATMMNGSTVTFSWDAATDAETPPAGLTYNLRVGTSPGGNEVNSAMSDGSGYRHIPALGNTNHNTSWTIELPDLLSTPYYWSVQALDSFFTGSEFADELTLDATSGVPDQPLPQTFALFNNVPNPFNPVTTIFYDLPSSQKVRLCVFDVSGRQVRVLLNGQRISAGRHQIQWDGRNNEDRQVSSGVYLYRLEAGNFRETKRMVLTK